MYESISDIYEAIQDGEANFFDLHDFICKRENATWERGYQAAMKSVEILTATEKL